MKYQIIGVVAGYLSWTILFLGGAAGVRRILSSTHDEKGFSQDPFTLLIYLGISLFASLAAAGITTYFAGENNAVKTALFLGCCLLATGIPIQISTWLMVPPWYHVLFLGQLIPVPMLSALAIAEFFQK